MIHSQSCDTKHWSHKIQTASRQAKSCDGTLASRMFYCPKLLVNKLYLCIKCFPCMVGLIILNGTYVCIFCWSYLAPILPGPHLTWPPAACPPPACPPTWLIRLKTLSSRPMISSIFRSMLRMWSRMLFWPMKMLFSSRSPWLSNWYRKNENPNPIKNLL